MLDVARRRAYPASPDELPDWLAQRPGYELMIPTLKDSAEAGAVGDWQVSMAVPADLASIADVLDPLVMLAGLGFGVARIEEKMTEVVAVCRAGGASWTEIGQVLGMTKQAAWERFSGEE
jgi:hypothetical protein